MDIGGENPDFALNYSNQLLSKLANMNRGGSGVKAQIDVKSTNKESSASVQSLSDNRGLLKGAEFYVISENLIK